MTNSRAKSVRGELQWRDVLRGMGFAGARRGRQHSGLEHADVVGGIPGTYAEVKRRQRFSLPMAMAKAEADAGLSDIPYVAHRQDNKPWLVTVYTSDLRAFARAVVREQEQRNDE